MLNIGLTGGIGAGKSAVSSLIGDLGARIVDADQIAREVVAPGTPALAQIVQVFGAHILDPAGALDRPGLARLIFGDDQARQQLNAIVHPKVRERSAQIVVDAAQDAIVVHDIPLLAEGTMAATFHLVLVVHAPLAVRLERLAQSRGMTEAEAMARIESQASDAQRAAIADVLIDNGGSRPDLEHSVQQIWTDRLAPYAQNLKAGRPADQPGRLDDEASMMRACRRIETALKGKGTVQVDHDQIVVTGSNIEGELGAAGWFAGATADEYRSADPAVSAVVHVRSDSTM
ncbi:MAG: dephospho-CoA kinase [Antricoccus sp.]